MAMGCSSETDTFQVNTKITRISVGTQEIKETTKTATNASTNAVTWQAGDEIAVFHVGGTGRSDFKHFVLASGANETSAYFEGVGADDYLTAGESYKVIYPYSSAGYTVNDDFNCSETAQSSNGNTDQLADCDWLYSTSTRISPDGTVPAFTLRHAFSLLKIIVDVENFTSSDRRYMRNFNIKNFNTELNLFADYVYWNDVFDFSVSGYTGVSAVGYSSSIRLNNTTTYIYWLPIKQNETLGIQNVVFTSFWATGITSTSTMYSSECTYTPSSVFAAGTTYEKHFKLTFADGSSTVAILTLVE